MIPDLAGRVIEIVKLDWGLHLWTDDNWEIILAEKTVVTTTDPDVDPDIDTARQVEVEVDVEPGPVPEPLRVEGISIVSVQVSGEGDLEIRLADRHLTVRASPRYEAWQLNGHGGEMFICSPGGELTHFSPLRPARPDS